MNEQLYTKTVAPFRLRAVSPSAEVRDIYGSHREKLPLESFTVEEWRGMARCSACNCTITPAAQNRRDSAGKGKCFACHDIPTKALRSDWKEPT